MKHFLIAGLSLLIFCFTSSLAIGEEVVASLPDADSIKQADTKKNMSNLPQEPAPTFMEKYKEQKWNTAVLAATCALAHCGEAKCCNDASGYWCKTAATCEMSRPHALRPPTLRFSEINEKDILN